MLLNEEEYKKNYDIGKSAMIYGEWKLAYRCFKDCLEYSRSVSAIDDDEIVQIRKYLSHCSEMLRDK